MLASNFVSCAEANPEKLALIFSNQSISYAKLHKTVKALASQIKHHVAPGSVVMVYDSEPSFAYITAILALLSSDCAYLPLDEQVSAQRIQLISSQVGCSQILTAPSALSDLHELSGTSVVSLTSTMSLIRLDISKHVSAIGQGISRSQQKSPLSTSEDSIANIIFTSGSSGKPKAVARTHQSIEKHVSTWAKILPEDERQRYVLASSPAFSMSMTPIFSALLQGGCLVIPQKGWRENLNLLAEAISHHGVTLMKTIPSLIEPLTSCFLDQHYTPVSLRAIILSGEAAQWKQVKAWKQVVPHTRIFNTYGMTEAFSVTSYEIPCGNIPDTGFLPLGKAIQGNSISLIPDPKSNALSSSSRNQIFVTGHSLAPGLLFDGNLTPLKLSKHDNLNGYITSDFGYIDSAGDVIFCGRSDALFKVNGYLIDPVELEVAIAQYPQVRGAAVANLDHQIVAFLECSDSGTPITVQDLRQFLTGRLPSYKIPHQFRVVGKLPVLTSGKLDRLKLIKTEYIPLTSNQASGPKPRNHVESYILDRMANLLDVAPAGIDVSWYALGGDSLSFQRLIIDIEKKFCIRFDEVLRNFSARKIGETVQKILESNQVSYAQSSVALAKSQLVQDINILLDPQYPWERVNVSQAFESEYTISQKLRLKNQQYHPIDKTYVRIEFSDSADERAIRTTLAYLINAHDALRATLIHSARKQVTHIVSGEGFLPILDARSLSKSNLEQQIEIFTRMPLEPYVWPAMRFVLIKNEVEDILIWQLSHTMIDVASIDVLTREFMDVYSALTAGSLKPLSVENLGTEWQLEMAQMSYSQEVIDWTKTMMCRYADATLDCKRLGEEKLRSCKGGYREAFIHGIPSTISEVSVLASYAFTLARWLGVSKVPMRIGCSARSYQDFKRQYQRTSGMFGDHFLLALDIPSDASVANVEAQLKHQLEYIRNNSVNFDKVIDILAVQEESEFDLPGMFHSCAPLGNLSIAKNTNASIRSIPRPTWGRYAFLQPPEGSSLIMLYTYVVDDELIVFIAGSALDYSLFSELVNEFQQHLPENGPVQFRPI